MFFVFRCYLLPFQVVTLYVLNVPEWHRKNTSFPWTRKRIDYFSFSGVLQQPCHRSESQASSHVMPTQVCVMAGIYGCGIQESAHLNMKTRHCISGWGGVVPLGLWLDTLSSSASRRRRWVVSDGDAVKLKTKASVGCGTVLIQFIRQILKELAEIFVSVVVIWSIISGCDIEPHV